MSPDDRRRLDAAARIAMPWRGTTAENPTVGAVLVDPQGVVIGRGVTAPGGRPHAETLALAMAGDRARGATLYVTLEPCAHWGRTPPCADAVARAGVSRVVAGLGDPDPRTASQGFLRLRAAEVAVELAEGHRPSRLLHEGFLTRLTLGRPFVTAKLAVSADGMIGRAGEGNVPITGEIARRWTHMQRALSDAVLVGAATARLDRPRLTVRLPGLDRRPMRVVLAGRQGPDFLETPSEDAGHWTVLQGMPSVDVKGNKAGLAEALGDLARRGVSALLLEGGAGVTGAFLAAGLIDRFHVLESDVVVGAGGVPASPEGPLEGRLAAAGFSVVDRRALGCDRLRTFEKT